MILKKTMIALMNSTILSHFPPKLPGQLPDFLALRIMLVAQKQPVCLLIWRRISPKHPTFVCQPTRLRSKFWARDDLLRPHSSRIRDGKEMETFNSVVIVSVASTSSIDGSDSMISLTTLSNLTSFTQHVSHWSISREVFAHVQHSIVVNVVKYFVIIAPRTEPCWTRQMSSVIQHWLRLPRLLPSIESANAVIRRRTTFPPLDQVRWNELS